MRPCRKFLRALLALAALLPAACVGGRCGCTEDADAPWRQRQPRVRSISVESPVAPTDPVR